MECVITANHHNEGTGRGNVSGGQMGVVVPAQGLAYSHSINMHTLQTEGGGGWGGSSAATNLNMLHEDLLYVL